MNEGDKLLTDEDRQDYYKALAEAANEDMAASGGFVVGGQDPYSADWQMDLSWPDKAGFWRGEDYVQDDIQAEVTAATMVVAKRDQRKGARYGQLRANTLKTVKFDGGKIREMREAAGWHRMSEWVGTPDPFAFGSEQAVQGIGGALNNYVPLWPGPVTRQLYWQDYWQMSAKAFEAYNHDPISWRCVHMKADFSLGRGLECKVTFSRGSNKGQAHDRAQAEFDDFWKRNKMDQRLDCIARDYCWAGEQFLRYFRSGTKLRVRSVDPASIYDLITDPEDHETVFAYHQQYQSPYQLYAPSGGTPPGGLPAPTGPTQAGSVVKYIIRQILPQEIDHFKANASGYERRGRSDLFPALGWIKRLRDYLTSNVIRADMLSRICWDLEVAGNASAISTLRGMLFPRGQAPQPGTVFGHNTASKLSAIVPEQSGSQARQGDPILDALVTMIADSIGLPKDWLGFGLQNTRAGALVATEPASKSLEELQGTLEQIVYSGFDRVMRAAGISDAELEVTFPSIASEDRQQKLDDLGTMEANAWLSKQTAATLAAKEMGITTYDYSAEQKLIAAEFAPYEDEASKSGLLGPDGKELRKPKQGDGKPRRTVIIATKRQSQKLDITRSVTTEDEPPGLLVPLDDGTMPAAGSSDGTGRTVPGGGSHDNGVTRGGAPANENPASKAGAKNIRKDNTNMREAEEHILITPEQLAQLLMRERADGRRRPDDPSFQTASQEYRARATAMLGELVNSAKGS